MTTLSQFQSELRSHANPEQAKHLSRFFKTGKGEYGEGDEFLGIKVPVTRKILKRYASKLSLEDVEELLYSRYHEERLSAVLIMVIFCKQKKYPLDQIAKSYLKHAAQINNWDLVDSSSAYIIGPYLDTLDEKSRHQLIDHCLESNNLWLNRIVVLASWQQIKNGDEKQITYVARKLLNHPHDLIQKAVGWMLRELGKQHDGKYLLQFLDRHAHLMPRTMLRYSIEHLPEKLRRQYMTQKPDQLITVSKLM